MSRGLLWVSLCCTLVLAVMLTGCATPVPKGALAGPVEREVLLAGVPELEPVPLLPVAGSASQLLRVDAEMRDFLERYVDSRASDPVRLNQLIYALASPGTFGLQYNDDTLTAPQVFRARAGNCLSFTALFVALAREVGLDARFQQVAVPPTWNEEGGLLMLNRHVNALVSFGARRVQGGGQSREVDFNTVDAEPGYGRRVVDDDRALAHYHSNKAVEALQRGAYPLAFAHLRAGLRADRRFAPLWTNLGALYSRLQRYGYAESSYLEALRHGREDEVALSNLSRLYESLGYSELADRYAQRVRYHRSRNPYYRYFLARKALEDGDVAGALEEVRAAIELRQEEDSFHHLLARLLARQGNIHGARAALEKAVALAGEENIRRRYVEELRALPPVDHSR